MGFRFRPGTLHPERCSAWQVVKLATHRKAAQQGQRDIFHIKSLYFEQKFYATYILAPKAESCASNSRKGISMECGQGGFAQAKGRPLPLVHGSKASSSNQPGEHSKGFRSGMKVEFADAHEPGGGLSSRPAASEALKMEDGRHRLHLLADPRQHPVQLLAELESLRRREHVLQATIAQHEEVVRCAWPGMHRKPRRAPQPPGGAGTQGRNRPSFAPLEP